jgi:hypothetical protein
MGMKLLWKVYYKFKFKGEYNDRINNAKQMYSYIKDSTRGDLSLFYDTNGATIRSWHRKRPTFVTDTRHPLERKYGN